MRRDRPGDRQFPGLAIACALAFAVLKILLADANPERALAVEESLAASGTVEIIRAPAGEDLVGCAADVVDDYCGRVFPWDDFSVMMHAVNEMVTSRTKLSELGRAAERRAWAFDIARTESALLDCLSGVRTR